MIRRNLFFQFLIRLAYILLLAGAAFYLLCLLNGMDWDQATVQERKGFRAWIMLGCTVSFILIRQVFEFVRLICKTSRKGREFSQQWNESISLLEIEKEATFSEPRLKLLVYKGYLITYRSCFDYLRIDEDIWKIQLQKFQKYSYSRYSGRNKSLLPPKYFLVLRDFDYKEYYLAISYQKEEWHHFWTYLMKQYPWIECSGDVEEHQI
jgi:hypothetical protein